MLTSGLVDLHQEQNLFSDVEEENSNEDLLQWT